MEDGAGGRSNQPAAMGSFDAGENLSYAGKIA